MKPNLKSNSALTKRVVTALILVPFVLLGLFYLPPLSFAIITALLMLIAASEWPKLMGTYSLFNATLYISITIIVMFAFYLMVSSSGYSKWPSQLLSLIIVAWWIFVFILVLYFNRTVKIPSDNRFFYALAGFFVIIPCWLGLNLIRILQHGRLYILFLFILVWMADSAAYFVGKKWGSKKLIPNVSPNKTREGVYGALIFTFIFAIMGAVFFYDETWQRLAFLALSLITVIFSMIGDLFISVLKRRHHLKDTGSLLPGHGGMLDRIDSLTAAAPIFAIGLILLGIK